MQSPSADRESSVLSEHWDSGEDLGLVADKELSHCQWILCHDAAKLC